MIFVDVDFVYMHEVVSGRFPEIQNENDKNYKNYDRMKF